MVSEEEKKRLVWRIKNQKHMWWVRHYVQRGAKIVLPHYIKNTNYLNFGNGQIAMIRSIIYIVIGFKIAYGFLSLGQMIALGLVYLLSVWSIGWFYDKNAGWELQNQWNNERNDLYRKIENIEKEMKKLSSSEDGKDNV